MPSLLSTARIVLTLVALLSPVLAAPRNPSPILDPNGNKLGAVGTEKTVCSNIGIDFLKHGGNAADALVGSVFCIGVTSLYHSGIGGGGFMIVRAPGGAYEFIDFRETAPAAAYQDMYKNNVDASLFGGLASGVPGELRGLEKLHTKYGTLPWADLIRPSINLARYGFDVDQDLIHYIGLGIAESLNPSRPFLVDDPAWAIDFAPNGALVQLGDTITRKRYADTLEAIATYGADAFYTGAIAKATIAALQAENGTMTMEDLKNYTVAIRTPAQLNYRGYKLTSTSAPSSGTVALSTFNILEGYEDIGWASTINISTHRLDEAIKFAYGQRTLLGDPSFDVGLQKYQESMLSAQVGKEVRSKITGYSHNTSYYDPAGLESLNTPGTSAIVTADASGMAISLTTTVNTYFGSQLIVPETGVVMNNEMNDFSTPGESNSFGYIPTAANYIVPGKRPLSSISPIIVEHLSNNSLYFATSAAGGSRIITANIQNSWHVLDQNMTAPQALAMPRLHDQLVPNMVSFEYAYNNETTAFMRDRGHNITFIAPGQSTAEAIRLLPNGTFEAAGEPRQKDSGGYVI